ncbi:hypothetical protein HanIR_Chr08g0345141 [Helianthus annuus]|nr:hypothetical protein HanIR_Chr08g0345141 [Helianthus annuus]
MKDTSMDIQRDHDHREEFDKNPEFYESKHTTRKNTFRDKIFREGKSRPYRISYEEDFWFIYSFAVFELSFFYRDQKSSL